ncbi:2Fe-2S iron-sulfur cluster-binding protein [Mycobacteroides abscessus]|uniref:2Fe-2S iron-sulfur cluster-binding protein n=1 Tax=Mycobacteroides abscessus TaxID=36809 RepID=UPI0005DABCE5|nr:2Fe-2S iron-sulfur cluster-binding protein [Mycobacteroides abscessus]MBE5510521.1 hypothetical protein [Mycobacteroides abscessus]MBN7322841.1 2Fe-2S iron-sulfur cluster binding domain-containing protein [Mycobacteroides abscessus subsp. massiliense]MBN7388191.1 2Fe-2S iron-sulfur cluster binding domain-containing protein [Mycobacteroides abscessus subsp. abscessus]MBN7417664.1 2Fe-2S iron-sulfur cluster binding domain-containing protein [Mycobacteroides abscessus subsp. abscessus]MBN74887
MDPALPWYLARAGGLMAWWLLSAATVWGLALAARITVPARSAGLLDVHRFLSVLAVVFLAVHLLGLLADHWIGFGLTELLVPFTSSYRPAAVAWGVVGFYLLAAVLITSAAKARIPHRWWRAVHTATFAVFVLTFAHALAAGSDATVVRITGLILAAAVSFLASYRVLTLGARSPAPAPASENTPAPPVPAGRPDLMWATVTRTHPLAHEVLGIELAAADGSLLPAWEPGAHIDVLLPSGQLCQYSLCGSPADRDRYLIAIRRIPGVPGGGSAEAHTLTAGNHVAISAPRNMFALVLAPHYLFIAGGIGITPIVPMVRAVAAANLNWQLIYAGRSRASMPFADELAALGGHRVQLLAEDTDGRPDLAAAVAATPARTAVYCCGPESLIAAVETTVDAAAPARVLSVHTERFTPVQPAPQPQLTDAAFQVQLHRDGRTLTVPADQSLLHVLREAVPSIPWSCGQGYCGACELRVLDGEPDHRDHILAPEQRHRRDIIYPCVSRAHSPQLIIDI